MKNSLLKIRWKCNKKSEDLDQLINKTSWNKFKVINSYLFDQGLKSIMKRFMKSK